MDTRKLTDILRGTIDSYQRHEAEEQLAQVRQTCVFVTFIKSENLNPSLHTHVAHNA